jgi:hypothetical protein
MQEIAPHRGAGSAVHSAGDEEARRVTGAADTTVLCRSADKRAEDLLSLIALHLISNPPPMK